MSSNGTQDWPLCDVGKGRKSVSVNPLTRVLRSLQGGSGKVKDKQFKSPRGTPVENRTEAKEAQAQETSSRTSVEEPLVDDELACNIEAAEASLLELRDLSTAARSFTRPHGPKNESPLAAYKPGIASPRSVTSQGCESRALEDEGGEGEDGPEEEQLVPRTKSESAAREAWHAARRQRQAQEQAAAHGGGPSSLEALLQRKAAAQAGASSHGASRHKRPPRKQLSSLSQVSSSTTSQLSGPVTPLSVTPPSHSLMGGGPFTLGRFKAMLAHQQRSQAATPTSHASGGSSGQPGSPEPHALLAGSSAVAAAAESTTAPHSHHALPTKSKTFSLPNAGSMLSSQDSITSHPPLPSKYMNLQLRTDAPPALAHAHSASPSPSPSGGLAPSPTVSGSLPPALHPPLHRISHGPGAPLSPLATRRISNSSTSLPYVRRNSLSMPGLPTVPPPHMAGSVGFAPGTQPNDADAPAGSEKPHAPSRSATHTTLLPDLALPKSLSRPSAPPVLAGSADSSPRPDAARGTSPLHAEGSYMQATTSSLIRAEPQHGFDPSMRSLSRTRSRNQSGRSSRGSEVGSRPLVKGNSSKRRLLKKNSSKGRSGKRRSSSGRSSSATTAHTPHSHGPHSGPSRGSSSVGSRFAGSSFAADTDSEKDDDGGNEDKEDAATKACRSVDTEAMEDTPLCEPPHHRSRAAEHEQLPSGANSGGSGAAGSLTPMLRGVLPQALLSQDANPNAPFPPGRASPSFTQQASHGHAPHMAQPSPLGLAPTPTASAQAATDSTEAITSWVRAHSHAHGPASADHTERDGSGGGDASHQVQGHMQAPHQPTPPPQSGAALPDSLASKVPLLSATKHARFNLPLNTSSSTMSSSGGSKPRPPATPASASSSFSAGQARNPALRPGTSTQDMNEGKLAKMKGDLRSYLAGQRMDVTRLEADSYLYKLEVECNTRPMGRFAGNKKGHKGKGSAASGEGTHPSPASLSRSAEAPSYLSRSGVGCEGVGASLAAMLAGLDEDEQELKRLQARSRAGKRAGRPELRDTREVEHREKWM